MCDRKSMMMRYEGKQSRVAPRLFACESHRAQTHIGNSYNSAGIDFHSALAISQRYWQRHKATTIAASMSSHFLALEGLFACPADIGETRKGVASSTQSASSRVPDRKPKVSPKTCRQAGWLAGWPANGGALIHKTRLTRFIDALC